MRRATLSFLGSLVLLGMLLAPAPSSAGGGEPHPLIRRAVNALQTAKTDLQDAAHDYCGHRVGAEHRAPGPPFAAAVALVPLVSRSRAGGAPQVLVVRPAFCSTAASCRACIASE